MQQFTHKKIGLETENPTTGNLDQFAEGVRLKLLSITSIEAKNLIITNVHLIISVLDP